MAASNERRTRHWLQSWRSRACFTGELEFALAGDIIVAATSASLTALASAIAAQSRYSTFAYKRVYREAANLPLALG